MDEQTALLIGICEECFEEAPLFNAILYGRSLQMCDKCSKLSGALVLTRPKPEQVYNSIKHSTKDSMRRVSGISPKAKEEEERRQKEVTMEEMRERARKLKEKKEKEKNELEEARKKEEEILKKKQNEVLDEKEFLDYLEKQMEDIKKQEEEMKYREEAENNKNK